MKIEHYPQEKTFVAIASNGDHIGEITYTQHNGNTIVATHTGVNPLYQGQGIAGQLLAALVDYATATNIKIIPRCSYVVAAFAKHPERYTTVVANKA